MAIVDGGPVDEVLVAGDAVADRAIPRRHRVGRVGEPAEVDDRRSEQLLGAVLLGGRDAGRSPEVDWFRRVVGLRFLECRGGGRRRLRRGGGGGCRRAGLMHGRRSAARAQHERDRKRCSRERPHRERSDREPGPRLLHVATLVSGTVGVTAAELGGILPPAGPRRARPHRRPRR